MTVERKALFVFTGITLAEGSWLFSFWGLPLDRVLRWFGLGTAAPAGLAAWLFALAIALVYCAYARRLPSVRATLFAPSLLKFVAVLAAVAAALCEEGVFRKMLMNALNAHGVGIAVQIALSALAFGAVHSIWGLLKGSLRAAFAAMAATGVLGLALAVVFASDGRNVWPCVIAHFIVTATIEPGLVLAALRGEMGGVAVAPATS